MYNFSEWIVILSLLTIEVICMVELFQYVKATIRHYQWLRKNGHFVKGRIASYIPGKDLDDMETYAGVVEYFTIEGQLYSIQTNKFRYNRRRIYTEVTVLYERDDPFNALISPAKIVVSRITGLLFLFLIFILLDLFLFFSL